MAIELPSDPGVLEDRLAALQDPDLAERLFRENPSLFADEAPQTQREVLAWTTRRVGTAVLAVTAAFSIAAGYFGTQALHRSAAPSAPHAVPAVVAAPAHRTQPAAHPRAASHPAKPVAHHAAAIPVARPAPHHASAPVVVHHAAVVHSAPVVIHRAAVAYPAQPDRQALIMQAKLHAQEVELARLRKHEAEQAAALHAAALQAARNAAQARARAAVAADPAAQPRPRTQPAAATATAPDTTPISDSATTGASRPDTSPTTSTPPVDRSDPTPGGGVKTPPTSPGGVWSERIPGHGARVILGPVVFGTPGDPCTPSGGRTGIVMQAISSLLRH